MPDSRTRGPRIGMPRVRVNVRVRVGRLIRVRVRDTNDSLMAAGCNWGCGQVHIEYY